MKKKRFCWFNFRFKILFIARIVPLSLKYDYACNYIICGYKWRNMKNQNNNHTLIKQMTHPWNNLKLWLSAHFSSVAVFPLIMLAAHRIALEPVLIFVNVFLETFIIVFKLTSFATLSSRGAPYQNSVWKPNFDFWSAFSTHHKLVNSTWARLQLSNIISMQAMLL